MTTRRSRNSSGPRRNKLVHRGAGFGLVEPLFVQGMTIGRPCILCQLADPQMIIGEDIGAAFLLHSVMLALGTPAHQRLLVAPGGNRQQPSLPPEAAIADVIE